MAQLTSDKIRNLGLFGHGGCGKTILAEAMLFSSGTITRMGKIEDGTTVSDYNKQEQERQNSISASVLRCNQKDNVINIIDTPGFADFIGDVVSGLRAVDMAVLPVDGTSGHDMGHSRAIELAQQDELPIMFFITKLDREHTKWQSVVDGLADEFGTKVQPIFFPVNPGPGFNTIACALTMQQYKYADDGSGKFTITPLAGDAKAKAEEMRTKLMETAAEADDELMEIYFDKGELSPEQFERGIRRGFARGTFYPVLCGAGATITGIHQLLDFVINYGPSPLNRLPVKAKTSGGEEIEILAKVEDPMSGLVFKTTAEPHVGELSFIRVFSGKIDHGSELHNYQGGKTEKIGQIFFMNGKTRIPAESIIAGDIGTMVKLRSTKTGDTICDKNRMIVFPDINFPAPVLETAVIPKVKGEDDKVASGLHALRAEDPSFMLFNDPELGQMVLKGQGDLHLNNLLAKLLERSGIAADMVEPRIPYRETIRGAAEAEGKHKKQSGGRGQYGFVILKMESRKRGDGYEFENAIVGGAIPSKFIPAVDKGIQETMIRGVVAGYPVVDVRVTLIDGKYHDVDSSEMAFKIAGRLGFKNCFKKCKPVLLEPIYDVIVKVPEEYMGDVMGDLSSRRGKIQGMENEGRYQVIKAKVPQKELYRYATALRSMTSGRGMATQAFSHYEEVPPEIQQKIIAEYVEEQEEE